MKKEIIEEKLSQLEIQLEWFDETNAIQETIHELSVLLKGNKNKDLQTKFDNLVKHFRKDYLGI